jgi:hypothetical protein
MISGESQGPPTALLYAIRAFVPCRLIGVNNLARVSPFSSVKMAIEKASLTTTPFDRTPISQPSATQSTDATTSTRCIAQWQLLPWQLRFAERGRADRREEEVPLCVQKKKKRRERRPAGSGHADRSEAFPQGDGHRLELPMVAVWPSLARRRADCLLNRHHE